MRSHRTCFGYLFVFPPALSLALAAACGGDVALGEQDKHDSAAAGAIGTGGVIGTGGSKIDAALGDASITTGGNVGTGGATSLPGTGGLLEDGGAPGSGGKPGTGGSTGSGGSTALMACGGVVPRDCPAGYFCEYPFGCQDMTDMGGICKATGGICGADYNPVCGCDGQTYSNDCVRVSRGVSKASDGQCPVGTGGSTGTGGKIGTGGASGTGGKTGTGGSTGAGEGEKCGGTSWQTCGKGLQCDLASDCGRLANATGTCVPTTVGCIANVDPVCGCDGKTYPNDCVRMSTGMPKASNGACSGDAGTTGYPTAYLAWEMPAGAAGTGPAVVVSGKGWADVWERANGFSPETPPSSATKTYTLTSAQTDDLFARLAAVNVSSLPHDNTSGWFECYPRLYFRLCEGCEAITLSYDFPYNLAPEMDPVWLWFEQMFPDYVYAHPRIYCEPF